MSDRTCFFIASVSPSGTELWQQSEVVYEQIVLPAAQANGYRVVRVDHIDLPRGSLITAQIFNQLLEADVAVADLSGLGPNVMYEVGVRHAMGRPVIPLVARGTDAPFDIATVRTIVYDTTSPQGISSARETLIEFFSSMESGAYSPESPVRAAFEVSEILGEPTTPGKSRAVVNVLKEINSRLAAVEHRLIAHQSKEDVVPRFSRRVFIVHGHDGTIKNELARLLEKLDFIPIILHEQPDRGQTVIEKLGREMADVGFAFVVLTPDDVGAVVTEPHTLKARARQNVVFEHGLFAGRLSNSRVCAIRRGDVELPSDLHGIVYKTVPVGGGIGSIALEIANELKAAGYLVDANRLLSM